MRCIDASLDWFVCLFLLVWGHIKLYLSLVQDAVVTTPSQLLSQLHRWSNSRGSSLRRLFSNDAILMFCANRAMTVSSPIDWQQNWQRSALCHFSLE